MNILFAYEHLLVKSSIHSKQIEITPLSIKINPGKISTLCMLGLRGRTSTEAYSTLKTKKNFWLKNIKKCKRKLKVSLLRLLFFCAGL